jgi:hypothetical protein
MLEFKPDYEQSKRRIDAFWERELIDRPVVQFALARPPEENESAGPVPGSSPCIPVGRIGISTNGWSN